MFLVTTIYLFNSFKQLGRKKKTNKKTPKTVSLQSHLICVCHKLQTKRAMCEIWVRPFQDRTAKRQAKSLRESRPTCQMVVLDSPGGRDWPYPAGWRLKTRKTKKKGKGRKRGRSSKTIVKIQKGTGIRTIEDPQQKFKSNSTETRELQHESGLEDSLQHRWLI